MGNRTTPQNAKQNLEGAQIVPKTGVSSGFPFKNDLWNYAKWNKEKVRKNLHGRSYSGFPWRFRLCECDRWQWDNNIITPVSAPRRTIASEQLHWMILWGDANQRKIQGAYILPQLYPLQIFDEWCRTLDNRPDIYVWTLFMTSELSS